MQKIRLLPTACLAIISSVSIAAESPRVEESFDLDWRFDRYGMQPDGSCRPEPGGAVTVTASSEEINRSNFARLAMDGDPTTRWCASGGAPNQWLSVDMGSPNPMKSVTIHWDITPAWKEKTVPYHFAVEGSSDSLEWTVLADFTQGITPENQAVLEVKGTYRFIRVRTEKIGPGEWASIRELILTDTQGRIVTQSPAPTGDKRIIPPLAMADLDDSSWRKLNVPHDWGIEGPFRIDLSGETAMLPWRGIGWYRKHFSVPASDAGKRLFLDFDGAIINAEIYCNGAYVGTWPYGYNSFRMDLTPHLKFGGENVVAVRLDTDNWDSRWYPGAGINRHVRLVKTNPVHVAHWGTFVTTPEINDAKARVNCATEIENQSPNEVTAEVRTEIYELNANDTTGAKVTTLNQVAVTVPPGQIVTTQPTGFVTNPKRWDLATPQRYLARTLVSVGGKQVDVYDTKFGIRTIEFSADKGFLLNGRRVKIQGTCNHSDLGALGAISNTRGLERQIEILKGMGCNSLRTAHNSPDPVVLELADKMGMLVWDEVFDGWAQCKRPFDYCKLFKEWHAKDIRALVRRDRNHPSVIIWSIGNEVWEQTDVALTKQLADIMRAEDSTRPISNGYNTPDTARASGACLALDLMGVNYFFGQQAHWEADSRYKDMPTIGSETSSAVSSRGHYFQNTKWQVTSYDDQKPGWGCTPDDQFRTLERFPKLLGEYVWTGFDYLGEPIPYSPDSLVLNNFRDDPVKRAKLKEELDIIAKTKAPSRSSYFGIIDLAGFPKDRYYNYQAHWRPELPMAHIIPQNWNWPDRVGHATPVHIYTSGDEAELFLNGQSLGKKKKLPGHFRIVWGDVKYAAGELKVVAYKDGKEWSTDIVKTTGPTTQLAAQADRATIKADGEDLSFITVRVTDAADLTVPDACNHIKFSIEGPGEIVATDNGDATSHIIFSSHERPAFNGLALVIVRAKRDQTGTFTVKAVSDGLKPTEVKITAK